MTKPNLTPLCKTCGEQFTKLHKRAIYCSKRCALFAKLTPGEPDECWEWPGARNDHGYGQLTFAGGRLYTHRLACEVLGLGVEGCDVRHTCDNPPCCNPAHLIPGSRAENILDMARKGRSGTAKLDASKVRDIRGLRGQVRQKDLAARYGVSLGTIEQVLSRKMWAHVT